MSSVSEILEKFGPVVLSGLDSPRAGGTTGLISGALEGFSRGVSASDAPADVSERFQAWQNYALSNAALQKELDRKDREAAELKAKYKALKKYRK